MKTLLLVLAALTMGAQAKAQYIPKFDLQGHRGARGLMPENTIPGFIKALDFGVTTIELDVAITKDRKVVVSHEPWMSSRICLDSAGNEIPEADERKYNIYQLTYEQIRQFDCGTKVHVDFPGQAKMKVSKPLLTDVIAAIEDHVRSYSIYEVDYNIEIKSAPEGDNKFHPAPEEFCDLVYELLDQYLPMERVVVQSFDFRILKYWHSKYPETRIAALIENNKSIDSNIQALGFKPYAYNPYFELLTKKMVDRLHKMKIRVTPWTVNEEKDMLALKGMGVDGLITDYPDRAAKYKMTLNIQRK